MKKNSISDNGLSDLKQQYELIARNPVVWRGSARDLLLAAEKLSKDFEKYFQDPFEYFYLNPSFRVYLLLCGLAMENLIKGLLIKRDSTLISEGKLRRAAKNHNLIHLFNEAKINLSVDERELLERLTKYVVWKGRYGIPAECNDLKNEGLHCFRSSDVLHIKDMVKRIDEEYKAS